MMKLNKTRFFCQLENDEPQTLLYGMIEKGLWMFFHKYGDTRPAQVGPHYPTEKALLADIERYATEFGF